MPLTEIQRRVLSLVGRNRTPDSYLAGGAALHFSPNSVRYSHDLDFFHDSAERVAEAFRDDERALAAAGYEVHVEISQPGFVRATVSHDGDSTRIDWAHDSAWRFMPPVRDELGGFLLHEVDLALNKVLALVGRDEARDFIDTLYVHHHILPLGALVWAAAGKDPGFTPRSLLELLKRRGRYRAEDFARLDTAEPIDPVATKTAWLEALESAEAFLRTRPPEELGALYYDRKAETFVAPGPGHLTTSDVVLHYGAPGGVLPQPVEE